MAEKSARTETANWDDRALLLLGVLMGEDQHGYQINEFIERALCRVTTMKKPTAYAMLDRLAAGGYISVHREQAGNRPPRKVYSITPGGEALFAALLRENLANASTTTDEGDIGLMMLSYLDRAVAIESLKSRLVMLNALIDAQSDIPQHGGRLSIELALDHLRAIRLADRAWLVATIERLEREPDNVNASDDARL